MGSMDDLLPAKDLTFQEILQTMLDGEENLDLKTHIFRPKQLAGLNIIGDLLHGMKFERSSRIIGVFIEIYLRYMVSFNRMSRGEVIKALSSMMEAEVEVAKGNPLTKNLK